MLLTTPSLGAKHSQAHLFAELIDLVDLGLKPRAVTAVSLGSHLVGPYLSYGEENDIYLLGLGGGNQGGHCRVRAACLTYHTRPEVLCHHTACGVNVWPPLVSSRWDFCSEKPKPKAGFPFAITMSSLALLHDCLISWCSSPGDRGTFIVRCRKCHGVTPGPSSSVSWACVSRRCSWAQDCVLMTQPVWQPLGR